MITDRDVKEQVQAAIKTSAGWYESGIAVDAVVSEIIRVYGRVDVETIPTNEFWRIVANHDASLL